MKILSLFVLLIISSGCSSKLWYNILQSHEQHQCELGPKSEYEECVRRAKQQSYEDYEKARKEET